MHNSGDVIQGSFPNGLTRIASPVLQRRATPTGSSVQLPPRLTMQTHGTGQPLPVAVRQKMESFFRTSFADVRVHVGPGATAIGATAFTRGSNIHFAPGHYDPVSHHGQQMLGHELAHVVQQRAARVRNPFGSGVAVVHDPLLESEAHRLGQQAAAHVPRLVQAKFGGATVQRIEPVTIGLGLAAVATVGAVAWGLSYCFGGRNDDGGAAPPDPVAHLKSMDGLRQLRADTRSGGDSQGTTALLQSGGAYYLIEQDNCRNCQDAMAALGVTYVNAGSRHTGWHAEMRMVAFFKHHAKGLAGTTIWVNKPICKACAAELRVEGVTMAVPIEAEDPSDDWVHWRVMAGLGYSPADAAYQGPVRRGWGSQLRDETNQSIANAYGDISNLDRSTRRRFTGKYT